VSDRSAPVGSFSRRVETARVTFQVEEAGCSSCARLIRDALSDVAVVQAIDVDEDADLATVRLGAAPALDEPEVNRVLAQVSQGSGHSYRLRPGSWRREPTGAR
jgi:copper chaperone CopZ